MPINAKLFAHINLDSELESTTLEGMWPTEVAAFLYQTAGQFEKEQKEALPASLKQALQEMRSYSLEDRGVVNKLKQQYQSENKGATRPHPVTVRNNLIQYFRKNISFNPLAGKIQGLSDGQSLTISGGYRGVTGASGHAVIYRFSKKNNEIFIEVFNTGDGVHRHFNASTQPVDWYQTQATYKLTSSNNLGSLLQELAIPELLPQLPTEYDTDALKKAFTYDMNPSYNALSRYCIKMQKKDNDPLVSRSYVGQQSGTCGTRSFTPLMYDLFQDKDNPDKDKALKALRERFRLYYKLQSIKEFYTQLQAKKTPEDCELLSCAVAKMIRIIRKKVRGGEEDYKATLNGLLEINSKVKKWISEYKKPVVAIASPETESFDNSYALVRYKKEQLQNRNSDSYWQYHSESLSSNQLEEWLKSVVKDSKLDYEIFYNKLTSILEMTRYGNFEKRCAIEKLVNLLHQKKIALDTSKVNDREKLEKFFKATELQLNSFKALSFHPSSHHIPPNLDTIRVLSTLAALTREACQHGMKASPAFPPAPSVGLYELSVNSDGFMETTTETEGLRADDYEKFHLATTPESQLIFFTTMEDEIYKNKHFEIIYKELSKEDRFDKRDCLKWLLQSKGYLDYFRAYSNSANFGKNNEGSIVALSDFMKFLHNESLFGIYSKRGILLQKLCCLDYQFTVDPDKTAVLETSKESLETEVFPIDWIFERPKILPANTQKEVNLCTLLNRSQLATREDSQRLPQFASLAKLGRTLVQWPAELVRIKKLKKKETGGTSQNNVKKKQKKVTYEKALATSMALRERTLLDQLIKDDSRNAESVFLESAFAESNLKFHNLLDFFLRNPDSLTAPYQQTVFMMGLFGGGGRDLPLLFKDHFEHLQFILDYNIKLFNKDPEPQHGVFLLELLAQFRDAGHSNPSLNEKFRKLLPTVLEACGSQPLLQKRALCAQLIYDIADFNLKTSHPEKKEELKDQIDSLCQLMLLNKKQQSLSSERNYRLFAKAGTHYFKLLSDSFDLLKSQPDLARQQLADGLFPARNDPQRKAIAASMSFNDFPDIRITVDGQEMLFNVARGELVNAGGLTLLPAIPEDYITDAFGPEHSHGDFVKTLQKAHKGSFTYQSSRYHGEDFLITAQTPTKDLTFYFQKSYREEPLVFLKTTSAKQASFQKVDFSCVENERTRLLLARKPHSTLWVNSTDNSFIVLDENLSVSFQGKMPTSDRNPDSRPNRGSSTDFGLDYDSEEDETKENEKTVIYKIDEEKPQLKHLLLLQNNYAKNPEINSLAQHLSHFAGNDFWIYQTQPSKRIRVELPGYGLVFVENEQKQLVCSKFPNLELAKNERMNYPGSVTLVDKEGKNYILLPNLPFIKVGEKSYFGDYQPDYALKSYQALKDQAPGIFNKYSQQRTAYSFEIGLDGKPIPKTPEEKLFLCYYFMNTRQYADAFSLIKSFRQDEIAEATFPIMELIYRILCEAPKRQSSKEKLPFNENRLAIKMQALLIAANLKVSKNPEWPEGKPKDFIAFTTLAQVKGFFENFPDAICRKEVLHYVRNISQSVFPEALRLKEEELHILLGLDLTQKLADNRKMHEWPGQAARRIAAPLADVQQLNAEFVAAQTSYEPFAQFMQACSKSPLPAAAPEVKVFAGEEKNPPPISISQEKIKQEAYRLKAETFFSNPVNVQKFSDESKQQIQTLEKLAGMKENLVLLCKDLQRNNPSILHAIEAQDRDYLTFEDLTLAFLRNNYSELAASLGVQENDPVINELMASTQNIMEASIKLNRLKLAQEALEKYQADKTPDKALSFISKLAEQSSEYKLTATNRELLIFEYHEQQRLRREQVESIEHVLSPGNENTCVQFIMGGGKTSVFLPLAAMKNADGEKLSLVLVPESLLAVNEKQLGQKTQQLFSSKSQTLHFDRDSSVAPDDLFRILKTLESTIKQRGYLVTSRETLQALELKYIELLGQAGDDKHEQSLDLLEEILLLFREKGKAIIDEVDSVLYIRKEFNYSNGKEIPIDKPLIKDTIYLYKILSSLPLKNLDRKNPKPFMSAILSRMLEDKASFVSELVKIIPQKQLEDYLLGEKVATDFMRLLNPTDRHRISLLKYQLASKPQSPSLLSSTLLQELNVTYGFSKLRPDCFSAIPYVCNNVAAEASRFSSPYETLNLTIQMHLAAPLAPRLLDKMIRNFRIRQFNEGLQADAAVTTVSQEFLHLTGLDLDTAYREFLRRGDHSYVLNHLNAHPDKTLGVKYYLLEHEVAPEITHYPEILKSDTISFVDQIGSTIGISGTLQNHRTFHPRMKLEEKLNTDTDARTLYYLREKNCATRRYAQDKIYPADLESALQGMLGNPKIRAIMDIGALFTGMSNADIAACLAKLLKDSHPSIRYVLYYDTEDRPWALSIAEGKARMLERTDANYLETELQCKPSERFTFYDQIHTTGSNIAQMDDGHALATIGKKTRLRDLVQGVMRMRGFAAKQTVEFLTSQGAGDLADINKIIAFTEKNQNEELLEDHYRAVCKALTAQVRNSFMEVLLKQLRQLFPVPPPENVAKRRTVREEACKAFDSRLKLKTEGPFEQYGQVITEEKIKEVLAARMQTELTVYEEGLKQLNSSLQKHQGKSIPIDKVLLQAKMQNIVDQAIPFCKTLVASPVSSISEQVEAQQQTKQLIEELQQLFGKKPQLKEEVPCKWDGANIDDIETDTTSLDKFHPLFDGNIFVTQNYGYLAHPSEEDQTDMSHTESELEQQFQRANVFCYFVLDQNKELRCTLLTPNEAAERSKQPWKVDGCTCWLEMPSGEIPVAGTKPKDIEKRHDYRRILEQVQFFHGDVDLLLKHKNPTWLGMLGLEEASSLLKNILSNPLFKHKKQFFEEHQKELTPLLQDSRINSLFSLTITQISRLSAEQENQVKKSPAWQDLDEKIKVLDQLRRDLLTGRTSAQKLGAFETTLNDEKNIKTLSSHRYISRGAAHGLKVFLKSMFLFFPLAVGAAVLDVLTLGTLIKKNSFIRGAHALLFKVSGKQYLDETKQVIASKNQMKRTS